MRRTIAGIVSAAAFFAQVISPLPVFAIACGPAPALIGTIRSSTTSQGYIMLTLDHAYYYEPSSLSAKDSTISIDAYNTLATRFAQNAYQLPAAFATKNFAVMNTDGTPYIMPVRVGSASLKTIAYKTGDIVIAGPDAPCNAGGFVGFFGSDGKIQAAIAPEESYDGKDLKYPSYTYGSETVTLTPGNAYDCMKYSENGIEILATFEGTKCEMPIVFSENSQSFTVQPSASVTFSTGHFSKVLLLENTQTNIMTTEPAGITVPGYLPYSSISPRYTLTFSTGNQPPKNCPALLLNLSRGSRGSDVSILQNFLISQNLLASGSSTGYFGALTERAVQSWQSSHGLISNGTPYTTGYGSVGPRTRAALVQCNV